MTHYIDGFLLPIAAEKLTEYKAMAETAGAVWMEHGALAYWECTGDDLEIEGMVSFKTSANAQPNEIVVFAWIIYPSRAERDRINEAVMADPRLKNMMDDSKSILDCTRMAYGGFTNIVQYSKL